MKSFGGLVITVMLLPEYPHVFRRDGCKWS